ncbi:integrase core domain-containing protein [Chryseobacterium sp. HMWF035]|uniref:integrase core domain-containing protein n=1 Tax=Chryseobacterium TaxID=59732 RepID=UPI0039774218
MHYLFENIRQMRNYSEIWMWMYNNERPHKSLQYLTPRDFLLKYGKIKIQKIFPHSNKIFTATTRNY